MQVLVTKLVKDNWVTNAQLDLAKQEAARNKKSIWPALVRLGYLSEEDIAIFFAQESGIPYVRISDFKIEPQIINLFEEDFCRQNSVIPLFKIKDTLFVACSNPLNTVLVDNLAKISGCAVEPLIASQQSIIQAIDLYCGLEDKAFEIEQCIVQQRPLKGIKLWRESERWALNIPVSLNVEDKSLSLNCPLPIEGYTRNVSRGGASLSLSLFLFLPKGLNVSLEFKPNKKLSGQEEIIPAKAEVLHCYVEKSKRYILGLRFTEIKDQDHKKILELAGAK